jgi:hypothetical protein
VEVEMKVMKKDERFLSLRLPAQLLQQLEDKRYEVSRTAGTRVSARSLVQTALELFLTSEDRVAHHQRGGRP